MVVYVNIVLRGSWLWVFVIVYATTITTTNPATQCLHKQPLAVVQTLYIGTLHFTHRVKVAKMAVLARKV